MMGDYTNIGYISPSPGFIPHSFAIKALFILIQMVVHHSLLVETTALITT